MSHEFSASLFHPAGTQSPQVVDDLAISYYRAVTARLEERLDEAAVVPPAPVCLSETRLDQLGYRCWTAELGSAYQISKQGRELLSTALAQMALCNATFGAEQDIMLDISPALGLVFAGIPLPRSPTISIVSGSREVRLLLGEAEFHFVNEHGYWAHLEHETILRVPRAGGSIVVTGGSCVDMSFGLADDIAIGAGDFEGAADAVEETLTFLDSVSESYSLWTRQMTRQVHVLSEKFGRSERRIARSSPQRPGHIMLTSPRHVALMAEEMVHESSHQHFYLFQLLYEVSKRDAEKRWFNSPINGRQRGIELILLAYHVVANLLIFFDLMRSRADLTSVIEPRLAQLRPMAREYLSVLSENEDLLTKEGVAFWRPTEPIVRSLC